MGTSISLVPIVFFAILLWASVSDIRTRQVPDKVSVIIAVISLIGVNPADIWEMCWQGLAVAAPLIIAALLKPGSVGGADIKIMAASAFLLGFHRGLAALCIGLALGVIGTTVFRKVKKMSVKDSFPLVPYLAAGCAIAFILL